jgi:predicted O-methyltransferase YrrM
MKHKSDSILHADQASYLERLEASRDPLLAEMEALAAQKGYPISDPEVATFLRVTIRAARATQIVELGTNIGYGAIVMAREALTRGTARVVTIENSPELCEAARAFAARAGLSEVVDVREGTAIGELEKLTGPFDLAYVDCVKEEYPQYLELLVPRLRAGGVIVADNVLWRGLVAADQVPESERARVEALRAFNLAITTSRELTGVILPLGDGVAFAVKR